MLGRIGTIFEMIKVIVRETQSALGPLAYFGRIENTGFRTVGIVTDRKMTLFKQVPNCDGDGKASGRTL